MAYQTKGSRRTIAVDFDGVIADYEGWKGFPSFGLPRRDVCRAPKALREEGWKIVIHTTRGEQEIMDYLTLHEIVHDEINRNAGYQTAGTKPVATVYSDDRAVTHSGDNLR